MSDTPGDPRPIARLRRVVAALTNQVQPDPADAAWLVSAVQRYAASREAGMELSMDLALGLGTPGKRGWWTEEAIEERDRLLRDLRERHFATSSVAEAAAAISQAICGMASGRVARDPALKAVRAIVQRTGRAIPGAKQLKSILGAGNKLPSLISIRSFPPAGRMFNEMNSQQLERDK